MNVRFALMVTPLVATLVACSSTNSGSVNTSGFVGTWSCNITESTDETSPPLGTQQSTSAEDVIFTANSNGEVTASFGADGGGAPGCSLTLSVSGSTASVANGTVFPRACSGGTGPVQTLGSFSFTVSGSEGTVSGSATDSGNYAEADGGTGTLAATTTLSGTCTKS